ncbi:MAG: response regulator [Candidatus Nitrosopolaris sp.]
MNKNILIIDDEPDIILTLRLALEQNGFRTDSYSDSILAYKNFRAGVYDLVLLDIKMPNVDGFQLHQKIKRTDSRVKICFLTASEFYDEEIRKEQGFDGFNKELFLRKPVEIACLIDTIRPLMDLTFN